MSNDDWVCLLINQAVERRGLRYLEKELVKIFGGDLIEVKVVRDAGLTEEGFYAFIRSHNYYSYSSALITSHLIKTALPSCQNPCFLSNMEVDEFAKSVQKKNTVSTLQSGDVVKPKEGHLSDLHGLVSGKVDETTYLIFFKFYVTQFEIEMDISNLQYVDNVFRKLKSPVTYYRQKH